MGRYHSVARALKRYTDTGEAFQSLPPAYRESTPPKYMLYVARKEYRAIKWYQLIARARLHRHITELEVVVG